MEMKLLEKALEDKDYVYPKMMPPMESYRFDILYIGDMKPPNAQQIKNHELYMRSHPLTPDECYIAGTDPYDIKKED